MTPDPDRPLDPHQPPPEVMPYPSHSAPLLEPFTPAAPQYHSADPFGTQPVVPQPFPPPVNVMHQYHPGPQVVVKRSFPHGLHLVLTLISCGLWSPIWLIHYLVADND
ncbi:hypothetical protein [Nocardia vermiculata]|uniref:Uncharacterized protein n=1 Tax=Nocardia vermiculata TaxID=257274 RepID=A0A846XRN0_9NOCA|nr:hypothetical protein [Nocardia vermiculata]NKY49726.1 hypothetical protein [Nocardia vermiculata]